MTGKQTSNQPPALTERQILALTTFVQSALLSADKAVELLNKPADELKELGLTEADLQQIRNYIKYVSSKVHPIFGW